MWPAVAALAGVAALAIGITGRLFTLAVRDMVREMLTAGSDKLAQQIIAHTAAVTADLKAHESEDAARFAAIGKSLSAIEISTALFLQAFPRAEARIDGLEKRLAEHIAQCATDLKEAREQRHEMRTAMQVTALKVAVLAERPGMPVWPPAPPAEGAGL